MWKEDSETLQITQSGNKQLSCEIMRYYIIQILNTSACYKSYDGKIWALFTRIQKNFCMDKNSHGSTLRLNAESG